MGLFDIIAAPFKSAPSPPQMRPRQQDPFARGYGQRAETIDVPAMNLLMQELQAPPGYTPEEYRMISEVPLQQQRYGEQQALRAMNRTAGATGRFGSGGRTGAEGAIRSRGIGQRADIQMRAPAMAAQYADWDRARKIAMAQGYVLPRQGISQRETSETNMYRQHLNNQAMAAYQSQLDQYNREMDMFMELGMMAGTAGTGGIGKVFA